MTATVGSAIGGSELDRIPRGAKVLWVSSTGGHLAELNMICHHLEASPDSLWVTFDTDQSTGFLADRRHVFVDYVAPRDLKGALRAARQARPLLRAETFDACISTGAAIAATILPMAALAGVPTYYVESLARPTGPSFTGRILQRAPKVHTLTQYPEWANNTWRYCGSTLGDWEITGTPRQPGPLKILVTLGTIAPYRFDRAVDAVLSLLREGDEVTWQLGATHRGDGLPGRVFDQVAPRELAAMSRACDVVVAHAGVGSILHQFELGHSPVLAVRRHEFGEHVDDHQLGIATTMAAGGLTSILDLDNPCRRTLEAAAGRTVTQRHQRLRADRVA